VGHHPFCLRPHRKKEIDRYFDSKFRATWATNKHKTRQTITAEDELIFLRGLNAFVTNKEVWENSSTKERKVIFTTKFLTKINGAWAIIHQHSGDCNQLEPVQQKQGM
jgi:hypothetical protein